MNLQAAIVVLAVWCLTLNLFSLWDSALIGRLRRRIEKLEQFTGINEKVPEVRR